MKEYAMHRRRRPVRLAVWLAMLAALVLVPVTKAAAATTAPPPASLTFGGEGIISRGQQFVYQSPVANFRATLDPAMRQLSVDATIPGPGPFPLDQWIIQLAAPQGDTIASGVTYSASNTLGVPSPGAGLEFRGFTQGGLRNCNTSSRGTFRIDILEADADGQVTSLSATFSQVCDGATTGTTGTILVGPPAQLPTPTSTTLQASAERYLADELITLTATVSPPIPGTLAIVEDGTTGVIYQTSSPFTGTLTFELPRQYEGAHKYVATFTPLDSVSFTSSTSNKVSVYQTNLRPAVHQDVTAVIEAGAITLAVTGTPVDLGTLTLDPSNTRFVNDAPSQLSPITITDTRAGQLGYSVTASVEDFRSGPNAINGANLGWSPRILSHPDSISPQAGPSVEPADAVPVGQASSAGLKVPRTLVTAGNSLGAATGSIGTVTVTADLNMRAPTNTVPGTYTALLTITVV